MRFQRFLSALVWCLGATLLVVAIAFAVEKFANRPLPGADWVPFAIAGGVAVFAAALIALLTGPSRVDAAVAIDQVFHLHERLSTALTLPEHLRSTPAGQARPSPPGPPVSGPGIGPGVGAAGTPRAGGRPGSGGPRRGG